MSVSAAAALEDALAEAREQQAATSEILRVIARSPTDVRPVFQTIADAALRLLRARTANVLTYDGALLHVAALAMVDPMGIDAVCSFFPRPAGRDSLAGRAVVTRAVTVVEDVQLDPEYQIVAAAVAIGSRSVLVVPLLRDGEPIGAIAVGRGEVGPFPASQVVLLRTFADQAVIAIENARLTNEREARNRELAEALEHQTATSEILRIISESPASVQPVLNALAERAAVLCDAMHASVFLQDGDMLWPRASHAREAGNDPGASDGVPLRRSWLNARAFLDRRTIHVEDILPLLDTEFPDARDNQRRFGFRAAIAVPMIRDQQAVGTIFIWRREPRAFAAREIALLQTFADQAVIAIENVRLFNETKEALEQQTATAEILRVISGSHSSTEPVFDAILASGARLTEADFGLVVRYEAGQYRAVATTLVPDPAFEAFMREPRRWGPHTGLGRIEATRQPVNIPDLMDDPAYRERDPGRMSSLQLGGVRSWLGVPMLREGELIGAILVYRKEVRPFDDRQTALLQTFADQAVIAIENVRLFNEIEDKSRQLEVASRHKSAFLANMSHELRTPLNAVLGFTRIVLRETRSAIEPKQAENLEKILASARHLVGLINATLDLSRIEAGRIEITDSDVALAPLLDDGLRTVEPLLADGVALACCVAPDLPPMRVDEQKLRQIVINLLSNAVKFTERGRIDVRAEQRDGRIEIAVADTGIGIPADKLEAVFEEFEQVDASHTRAHGGTGLGLAIARRLARAMDGELSATTVLGVGSTFTLDLPLRHGRGDEQR